MRTINFNEVVFTVEAQPELTDITDEISSGDPLYDERNITEIRQRLENGDIWAWCTVKVTGTYRGIIQSSDHLGGCSYQNAEDFIRHSGYYKDMQLQCIRSIQDQLQTLLFV